MAKRLVREIEPHKILYRDTANGIAWIEDGTNGSSISVHGNIHISGSVRGMKQLGYWRKTDRVVRSHGWQYNIDTLTYDKNDKLEMIVLNECMCMACIERREGKRA